ncbi:YT521-B-like domain-containing protein [Mycena amicta]|nr:YT521-B-like domain-containing protein [Mycena amicta]
MVIPSYSHYPVYPVPVAYPPIPVPVPIPLAVPVPHLIAIPPPYGVPAFPLHHPVPHPPMLMHGPPPPPAYSSSGFRHPQPVDDTTTHGHFRTSFSEKESTRRYQPPASTSPYSSNAPSTSTSTSTKHSPQAAHRLPDPPPAISHSQWAMWVGNVPSDASVDELLAFFQQRPDPDPGDDVDVENPAYDAGIVSIYPITHTRCAFVNYRSETHLQAGIVAFDGRALRPSGAGAPLVCRARARDDDTRTGVWGQRGKGMHRRWVTSQTTGGRQRKGNGKGKEKRKQQTTGSPAGSQSDGGSTSSSLLEKHFPDRFFILKSRTQADLDLSVERGVWATQRHNEPILDRAFRIARNVFLIFGVNRSGEFYGYARMTSGVGDSGDDDDDDGGELESSSASGPLSQAQSQPTLDGDADGSSATDSRFVPPWRIDRHMSSEERGLHRRVAMTRAAQWQSAPAVLGRAELDAQALSVGREHDEQYSEQDKRTGVTSPSMAMASGSYPSPSPSPSPTTASPTSPVAPSIAASGFGTPGRPFRIQWLCTHRLPFELTNHLHNLWNSGRAVKISRDGTELEPEVGKRMLEVWKQHNAGGRGSLQG